MIGSADPEIHLTRILVEKLNEKGSTNRVTFLEARKG